MTGCLARRAQADASSGVVVINSMKTRRSAESADMSRVFRRIRALLFLLHFCFRTTTRAAFREATQAPGWPRSFRPDRYKEHAQRRRKSAQPIVAEAA